MLRVENLSVKYDALQILNDVSFEVVSGQWLMLVGPNGAGKSTLVTALSKGVSYTGKVCLHDRDIMEYRNQDYARQVSVMAQSHYVNYHFTIREVVELGRYAYHKGLFKDVTSTDNEIIDHILDITGLAPIQDRSVMRISGGELQRTFLAQALVQDPEILILDEPTNNLDLLYQKEIFELLEKWLREKDRAIISVVHNLSLAKHYGTNALLLNKGQVVGSGKVGEVLNRDNLINAFSMDVYGWMNELFSEWK